MLDINHPARHQEEPLARTIRDTYEWALTLTLPEDAPSSSATRSAVCSALGMGLLYKRCA